MLKAFARRLLQTALWVIDPDHRSDNEYNKYTHVKDINFQSDFGQANSIVRTLPYEIWELKTDTHTLYAADEHIVILSDMSECYLRDLKLNDWVKTETGDEQVRTIRNTGSKNHMYSLGVQSISMDDPFNNLYYTNGILSHNTTTAAAYILWRAMFVDDSIILITANKLNQAIEIMDRVRLSYESIEEDWIRPGVVQYAKTQIEFDNGSKIHARATTRDAGRGLSISLLFVDEMAFIPKNVADEFWSAIQPTLAEGGGSIIMTTPISDQDLFATELWFPAIDVFDAYGNENPGGVGRNGYKAVKAIWSDNPDRTPEWAEKERKKIGIDKFRREHECDFIAFDPVLINNVVLAAMKSKDELFKTDEIRWYREIQANQIYVVALDPSTGTGGDYAAIQVFELPSMAQVAEWRHNHTDVKGQVQTLMNILQFIKFELETNPDQDDEPEIFWTFENNGVGEATRTIITMTGEDNFPGRFISEPRKGRTATGPRRKGLHTSKSNKLNACLRFKSYIESQRMTIYSSLLLKELKSFVEVAGGYKAKPGETDDLVMAVLLCVRLIEMISAWDEDLAELLTDAVSADLFEQEYDDGEEGDEEPLPVII